MILKALSNITSRIGRVFTLQHLKRAYQLTFFTPVGKQHVLPDLCEFCYGQEPAPRTGDLFVQGRAAGRRDVWLHITELLEFTEEELVAAYQHRLSLTQKDFEHGTPGRT